MVQPFGGVAHAHRQPPRQCCPATGRAYIALPGLQLKTAGGRQETVSKWGTENAGRLFSFPVSAVGHAGTALRRDPSGPANFEHFHERHTGPRRFVRK